MNKEERLWKKNRTAAAKLKNPTPVELPSHAWRCQITLNGKRVGFVADTPDEAHAQALAAKAGLIKVEKGQHSPLPLTKAIDAYIDSKSSVLSPSTIRGYRSIQEHRFKSVMGRDVWSIQDSEWQRLINDEAKIVSATTVKKSFSFIHSVIAQQTGHEIPTAQITLPKGVPAVREFLRPAEIPIFVEAVKDTDVAIPALLALSSLRLSEIYGLRWENIPKNPKLIQVAGAMVRGEDGSLVYKQENKNRSSTRNVPMLIPELAAALERERKPDGFVVTWSQTYLRHRIHEICQEAKITNVTVHGLRHSFASLAYHLRVPERIAMEIGGWSDQKTMHNIYTHVAQSDIEHYQSELFSFFQKPQKVVEN